ncbi:MAG: hypothetical protein IJD91_01210 [Clostridia bacterium]|nr:hypothetical protein [Clostridia bacterium]
MKKIFMLIYKVFGKRRYIVPKKYTFSSQVAFVYEPTIEKIEKAKQTVVEDLCNEIRNLANEYPEYFFVINKPIKVLFNKIAYTVGAKLIAPTIDERKIIKNRNYKD